MNGINVPPVPDFLNKEQIDLLKRTLLKGFSDDDKEVFVQIVLRAKLDPWSRQIYATKRNVRAGYNRDGSPNYATVMIPITSIQGLTAIADRTGNYDGCEIRWCAKDGAWREEWLEEDEFPAAARCTVFHKKRQHPEVGIARWMSFAGQQQNKQTKAWEYTDFWLRLPDYMLGKCSKAMALRGAFPDQLSDVYIAEELEGRMSEAHSGMEQPGFDEAKIASNQERETQVNIPGATFVETKPEPRPSPAEALEPAFPEDREQKPPPAAPARKQAAPAPEAARQKPEPQVIPSAAASYPATPPDDLDMTPVPEAEPPWKTHVIKGVKSDRYKGRTIGELTEVELNVIEQQWLPKVRAQWDDATADQKADATAFEAAIAYRKIAKPW